MNRIEISEVLLSEVLDINDIVHVQKEGSCSIFISRANNPAYIINIYDFAFRCKKWTFSKGYIILTEYVKQNDVFSYVVSNKQSIENYGYLENVKVLSYIPHNKSEVEAIVKACEWIIEKEIQEENRLQLQEDLTEYSKLIKEGL